MRGELALQQKGADIGCPARHVAGCVGGKVIDPGRRKGRKSRGMNDGRSAGLKARKCCPVAAVTDAMNTVDTMHAMNTMHPVDTMNPVHAMHAMKQAKERHRILPILFRRLQRLP